MKYGHFPGHVPFVDIQAHLDDLAATQVETEGRVPPVAGGVKLGAILQGANVVHLHLVSLQGLAIYVIIIIYVYVTLLNTICYKSARQFLRRLTSHRDQIRPS